MATAEQYADWIVKNADKKGTPEFDTVAQAYQLAKSQPSAQQAQPKRASIGKQIGLALAEGAGEIGSTLMAPVDAAARAMGIENDFIGRDDRREAMRQGAASAGADQSSALYQAVKLVPQVAGTAGMGGVLARGAAAVPMLSSLAPALASSGLTAGGAGMATRMLGGGITGAASAGLVNPDEMVTGGVIGAGLPPALRGAGMVGKALGVTASAPKAAVRPFTQRGQEDIVADIIQKSATDPKKAMTALRSAAPVIPGSQPTVAQVANDPGLAQLERTLLNNPELAGPLQQRYGAQRAARLSAINDVAGTDEYFDAIKQGRALFAKEDYAKAVSQGIDQEVAQMAVPAISDLLERPSIKQAQTIAKELAAEARDNIDDFGSVKGLDYLKKALDEQISAAKKPGSAIGETRLRALEQTRSDLMTVLEDIAPAYKEAVQNYAQMSKQVNSMQVARELRNKFEPAMARYGASDKEMADAYARALTEATQSVKKATKQDVPLSRIMNTQDIAKLEGVARDLARKSYAQNAGKAVGSPTAQNIVSQNLIDRLFSQAGLPQSVADSGIARGLLSPYQAIANVSGATDAINNRLAMALLDPTDAAMLLSRQTSPGGLLGAPSQMTPQRQGLLQFGYRAAPVLAAQ